MVKVAITALLAQNQIEFCAELPVIAPLILKGKYFI